MKDALLNLLMKFVSERQFTYRFDEYDGSEDSNQIYDGQVVEYEFINTGSTVCIINAGLKLYPVNSGMLPNRVKLHISYNEMDVTIYDYRFSSMKDELQLITDPNTMFNLDRVLLPLVVQYADLSPTILKFVEFNRLIVISKVKASVKPRKRAQDASEKKKS